MSSYRADDSAAAEPGLPEVSTARGLSLVASVGGFALLLDRGEVEADLFLTHDESRLFVQYIEHLREYLQKRKSLDKLIHLPEAKDQNARGGRNNKTKSALPEHLGLKDTGNGKPWDIFRFNEEARSSANSAGVQSPTVQQLFSHGLTAAARLNPLYLDSPDDFENIVRLALFALPEYTSDVTAEQLQYVAHHVRSSLRDHLNDSDEEFKKWIM